MAVLQMKSSASSCYICRRSLKSPSNLSVSCELCGRRSHLNCISFLVSQENFYCSVCLQDIFPYNHIKDDVEFNMAVLGLPHLPNFDYFKVQNAAYALNRMPQWVGHDLDVDEFYYDQLSMLHVQYLDASQLSERLAITENIDLTLLHINARSIRKNSNAINVELAQLRHKFSLIAISETWATDNDLNTVFIPGYTMLLNSRSHGKGGGVALFLNEITIPSYTLKCYSTDDHLMESLFIQICNAGKSIIIGVV